MASSKVVEKDNGAREFFRSLKSLNGQEMRVGIFGENASKTHPNGDITIGDLAIIHEFGTPTIPARSFLRSTMDRNARKYLNAMTKELRRRLKRSARVDYTKRFLDKLGSTIKKDILKTIDAHIPPPLADGSGRTPLVDTGTLRGSIQVKVEKKR